MKLQDILEKFKKDGNYSVALQYGENVGCDDLDIPQNERKIIIWMSPVGYLGEVRKMVRTNLSELENFDFGQAPKIISNPPKYEEYNKNGVYIFGTDTAIKNYINRSIN
jgi:hypothetical protein